MRFIRALLTIPLLLPNAFAETFHLKDGRNLEGRIIRESDEAYVVEVSAGRGIWEEITLAKEDVERVEIADLAERQFKTLSKFTPTPDLLSADEYSQRLQVVREFISTHSESTYIAQAREILDTLEQESEVISKGGLKLGDKLITADARLAKQYEIDARVAEAEVVRHAKNGNVLAALRAFTTFDREFGGSEAWHNALPMIQQLLNAHQSQARDMLNAVQGRISAQEIGLSRMSIEERQSTMRAIAERDAGLKARHDQEKSLRGYWLSIHPDYAPALQETIRFAEQESQRLATAAGKPLPQPSQEELWRNAYSAIQAGDPVQMRQTIQAIRSARMAESYVDRLQNMADTATQEAAEAKRQQEEARRLQEEEAKRIQEESEQAESASTEQGE